MGNTSCTDAVPFTLDDILLSNSACSHRHIEEVLTAAVTDRFTCFHHNFKAFAFRQRSGAATGGSGPVRLDVSQVYALPLDLSQRKVRLEDTTVYVLLHVQRTPIDAALPGTARKGASSNSTPRYGDKLLRNLDATRRLLDEAPPWAAVLSDVFTPRGLATAFSTNIGKPPLTLSPYSPLTATTTTSGMGGFDFRYSVHVLSGVKANPVVTAVAVLHALRIERTLTESEKLVQALFFNYNARRSGCDAKVDATAFALVGEVTSAKIVRRTARLSDEYTKNAILRILYRLRSRPALMTTAVVPSSSRSNLSCVSTPRGRLGTPVSTSTSFFQQPQLPAAAGVLTTRTASGVGIGIGVEAKDSGQSPLGVEIPPLRFVAEASQQSRTESQLTTQRRTGTRNPQISHRGGSSAKSNTTNSSSTPHASTMSPRFPITFNLRLSETLNRCGANDAANDVDEIRMTEERLQKLKAASPQATEILPWLFVGGEEAARDRAQLLEKGITAVVNTIAFALGNLHESIFRYLGLYVCDSPDEPIFSLFPVVIRFIEEARVSGGKTFIHCHQGVSRSCSFVIAYVMWYQGVCYDHAFDFVRARRNICSPNAGFYVNLLLWENHLAAPVLNRAYAYVPYAEYLFPFSYQLALTFCCLQKSHDEGDNLHIVNQNARTVHEASDEYVLDPRLSYGFLFGECGPCSDGHQTCIASHFFADVECDVVVRQQAKDDWDAFIKYGFYHGHRKTSTNNKGEHITFTPLPPLAQPTECLWNIGDIEAVLNDKVFGTQKNNSCVPRLPKPKLAHDPCWDALLARGDIASCFANHLAEEQRTNMSSGNRKRTREEERRGMPKTAVGGGTPRLSAHTATASAAIAASTTQSARSPPSGTRYAAPPPHRLSSSTPSSVRSLSVANEPEIYAYPFTGSPLSNVIEVADMETDRCYAVVVPAAASTSTQHRVFLWLGRNCCIDEADARHAYQRSLKVGRDVRLYNGAMLSAAVEEVVHEGEEPDELILALD